MTSTSTPSTKREQREAAGRYGAVSKAIAEMDERLGAAKARKNFLDKIFPDHWSFMLGEITLYSFIIILATGVFLTLYFVPSQTEVIYHGSYVPLRGARVTQAFASTVDLSFDVRCGLLMRQMHHWACNIFVGSMVLHMMRVFFTGAFRKPRELNWTIGVTLLTLAILNGFVGYSLPDDLVSGTGLRIGFSILLSIPLVGSYLAFFVFGGNFPGTAAIPRFFIIHVLLLPLVILGLIGAHLGLLAKQQHTQFPGKGRTERNVVGTPMFPNFMFKAGGFFFMTAGVTALLGALVTINPIWVYGPYDAAKISYAVQPDFYMGWLDGAARIMPAWEFSSFGHTWPLNVFIPAVIFPGIIFNICYAWPAIDRKRNGDHEMHNLLDNPRDVPKRTAAGAAMLALIFMVFVASSTDVMAYFFHLSLNTVLWAMRFLVVIVPLIVYPLTFKVCVELSELSDAGKRKRHNVVTRSPKGEYVAEESPELADDVHDEADATPVPTFIEGEAEDANDTVGAGSGVRQVDR